MMPQFSYILKDNVEHKYTKALMEIKKLHSANQLLRNQSEQIKKEYENKNSEIVFSLVNMQNQHKETVNQQNYLVQHVQSIEVKNSQLNKQILDAQEQIKYLNDLILQQNKQIKTYGLFKQQKGLVMLICSYEQREQTYKKDIKRHEQVIKSLKLQCLKLQNELDDQRRTRLKLQELNSKMKAERDQYKDINVNLIAKNQDILNNLFNKNHQGKYKFKQAQQIIHELNKYIQSIKMAKLEHTAFTQSTISPRKYQELLQERITLQNQMKKFHQKLEEYQNKHKQFYQLQQKMNKALIKSQQLQQQCNFLKNKIILLEAQDIIQNNEINVDLISKGQYKYANVSYKSDGYKLFISNTSNPSHFQLMKTFIIDLNSKIEKGLIQKKDLQKKNSTLKQKLNDKMNRLSQRQQQNGLLRLKMQGLQKLAQKSHKQLQQSIQTYEEQLSKVKDLLYNVLNKKSEQKVTHSYVSNVQSLHSEEFQLVSSKLKHEIQSLTSELKLNGIKMSQLEGQKQRLLEHITIYKNKFQELKNINLQYSETIQLLQSNSHKYQQLFRSEQALNETLTHQKQAMSTNEKHYYQQNQNHYNMLQHKESEHIEEINRLKIEIMQLRQSQQSLEASFLRNNKLLQTRVQYQADALTKSGYVHELQIKLNASKEENAILLNKIEDLKKKAQQLQQARIKLKHEQQKRRYLQNHHHQMSSVNSFQKEIQVYQNKIQQAQLQIKEIKTNCQAMILQNSSLKKRLQSKQDKQAFTSKVTSFQKFPSITVSPQKESNKGQSNLEIEYSEMKVEKKRSEDMLEQIKRKESALSEQFIRLRDFYQQKCEQCQLLKNEIQYRNEVQFMTLSSQQRLTSSIDHLEILNQGLDQDNSNLSLKLQEIARNYSNFKGQVESLRYYLNDIELSHATNNWQEDQKSFFNTFIYKIKAIIKNSQNQEPANNKNQQTFKPNVHFPENRVYDKIYESYDYIQSNKGQSERHLYSGNKDSLEQL